MPAGRMYVAARATTQPRPVRKRARRVMRRRIRRRAPMRLSDNSIYKFKRTYQEGSIVSVAGVATYGSISFSLSKLTNPTEFQNLFDNYKITGVLLRFMPRITEATGVVGSNGFGSFMYVPDYDDVNLPVNQLEILEKQSFKMRQPAGRPWKLFLRPQASVNNVGGFGQTRGWQDTSSPNVLYYGLKYVWNNINTAMTIDVYATYYLSFKSVK